MQEVVITVSRLRTVKQLAGCGSLGHAGSPGVADDNGPGGIVPAIVTIDQRSIGAATVERSIVESPPVGGNIYVGCRLPTQQQWFIRITKRRLVTVRVDEDEPSLCPACRVLATEITAAPRADGYFVAVAYRRRSGQVEGVHERVHRLRTATILNEGSQGRGAETEQDCDDAECDE
jgi:hypothetical protein